MQMRSIALPSYDGRIVANYTVFTKTLVEQHALVVRNQVCVGKNPSSQLAPKPALTERASLQDASRIPTLELPLVVLQALREEMPKLVSTDNQLSNC